MIITGIVLARAAVRLTWLAATVFVLALAVIPHLLPVLGREMYVVRGGSMEPAIPLGSVIVITHVDPQQIAVGDVVTFRAPNSTVVTHRVVGLPQSDYLNFETKGDASAATDPIVVPAWALIGRVELFAPSIGTIMTVLSSTIGAVATLGLLGGLLLAVKFMDEVLVTVRGPARRRTVLTELAR